MNTPVRPPLRKKPLREQLQEAVNASTVELVEQGFKGIDTLRDRAVQHLRSRGIVGTDELADSAATVLKKLLARGISK